MPDNSQYVKKKYFSCRTFVRRRTNASSIQIFFSTRRTSAPALPDSCQCFENDFCSAPVQPPAVPDNRQYVEFNFFPQTASPPALPDSCQCVKKNFCPAPAQPPAVPDNRQYVPDLTPDNCQYVHKVCLPDAGAGVWRAGHLPVCSSDFFVRRAGRRRRRPAAFFAPDNCQYVVKKILSGEPGRTPAPVPGRRRRQPR